MPAGKKQTLSKVPGDAFLRSGGGDQIDSAVPSEQHRKIGEELRDLSRRELDPKWDKEFANFRFGKHGL